MLLHNAKEQFINHLQALNRSEETIRAYNKILDYLDEHLSSKFNGPVYLEDITFSDLDDFIYYMRINRGWAPNSVQRSSYAIRSFFGYCFRKKLIAEDISIYMEPVKGEQKEREYLAPEDYDELSTAIDHPTVHAITATMYYAGVRIGEAISLSLDDVDFGRGVLHVRKTKGKVDRVVPISDKLRPILEYYKREHRPPVDSNYFFATKKSGCISRQHVTNKLHEATKKLSWKQSVNPHVLRHSFASNLIKENVHLVHVQKLLGHKDLRTTGCLHGS